MILDLSKSSREKFYSLVSITKFSDSYTRMKGKPNDFLLKTKMPYRKIDKKQLDRYIEDNLLKVCKVKDNKIFSAYLDSMQKVIASKYEQADELAELVKDKTYGEIQENSSIDLSRYEKEFEKADFPFSFEELVQYMSKFDSSKKEDIEKDRMNSEIEELKKSNSKLTEKIATVSSDAKEKENKLKSEIQNLKSQISELKKKKETTVISKKLSEFLGEDIKGKTYSDVLEKLDDIEKICLREKDYEKAKLSLAAKYALLECMEGK